MISESKPDLRLLPGWFKYISLGIAILLIMGFFAISQHYLEAERELMKKILWGGLLILFLLILFTRNRVENTETIHLRLKAMAGGFLFVPVSELVYLTTNLSLYKDENGVVSIGDLVMNMIIFTAALLFAYRIDWKKKQKKISKLPKEEELGNS